MLMKKFLAYSLALAFIITVIFGTIYAVAQQSLREGANDPQIELAEDTSAQINRNVDYRRFITSQVDIATSLLPFTIVYDTAGNELASSALLDGTTPVVPRGVLTHAKPQNRVTWEPRQGVRIAAVVQANKNGYVLSGRNMREVESREGNALALSAFGWLLSEAALASFVVYKFRFANPRKQSKSPKAKK